MCLVDTLLIVSSYARTARRRPTHGLSGIRVMRSSGARLKVRIPHCKCPAATDQYSPRIVNPGDTVYIQVTASSRTTGVV